MHHILVCLARFAACAVVLVACSVNDSERFTGPTDAANIDTPAATLGIVTSSLTFDVTEGSQNTFTVNLSAMPGSALTVNATSQDTGALAIAPSELAFDTTNWDQPQTVTATGIEDDDTSDETVAVELSSSAVEGTAIITASVNDNDSLGVVVSPATMVDVGESSTTTLQVRLSAIPSGPVTVDIGSNNTTAVTVAPATLAFTTATWNIEQTVTLTALGDSNTTNEAAVVSFTSTGLPTVDVAVQVFDDDVLGIQPSTTNLGSVTEGATTTFDVQLTQMPTTNVTVNVASSDTTAATVSPATLTFTPVNWNVGQQVTVTAPQDLDATNAAPSISLTASGLATRTVAVSITDDDTQSIVASPTSLTIIEATAGTIDVRLAYKPTTDVTVTASSLSTTVATVTPGQLIFTPTNYATTQAVTVTAPADADATGAATTVRLQAVVEGLTTDVATTVIDDDMLAMETSTSTLTIGEAGSGMFGVRLTAQPASNVTVTVASPDIGAVTVSPSVLTFTSTNWNTFQQVSASGVADDDLANESVALNLTSPGLLNKTVTATVTDDDTQDLVVSTTTVSATETGTGTFDVRLAFRPSGNVSVTVASADTTAATVSPATLTFDATNWDTNQAITVSGVNDPDTNPESVAITVASTGLTPKTVQASITDDDSQSIVTTLNATTVVEGGTAPIGVKLGAQPTANVTVDVTSGDIAKATTSVAALTFTPSNWNTFQTVTVSGVEDGDVVNDAVTITLSSVGLTDKPVTVTVNDNDSQNIITTTNTVNVNEGTNGSLGVRLQYQPAANVVVNVMSADTGAVTATPATLTFTPTNWNTDQPVTVVGVGDLDTANESVIVTLSSSGITDRPISVNVADDDVQGIVTSSGAVTLAEGGTATFGVHLAYQPSSNVTLTLTSDNTATATVSPATLTFTPTNYATDQTVTVTGVEDIDLESTNATVTLASAGLANQLVTASVTDNDTQAIVTSVNTITLGEAGNTTFGVRLAYQPSGNVSVTVSSSNTSAANANPNALTFTPANWNLNQNVTVSGVDDPDVANDTSSITLSTSGAPDKIVTASITDNDVQSIVTTVANVSVGEGATATFGVRLAYQPSANVTVNVASGDTSAATVSPISLTFTPANYATNQLVTVSGAEDVDLVNDAVTVSLTSSGIATATVSVATTDNDAQAIVTSATAVNVTEGGTATFGVSLAYQPSTNVTVNVASNTTAVATAAPATLTFTPANYATPQTVTVSGVHDADLAADTATITVSSTGLASKSVTANVADDDSQAILTTLASVTVSESGNGTFGVRLAYQPAANVTVTVASSDTSVVTAGPVSLTFTPANYATNQTVTVSGVADIDLANEAATITLSSAGVPNATVNATITDDDTQRILTTSTALTVNEGGTGTFGVHLAYQPSTNVTVTIASSDTGAATATPATLTFTPANYATDQSVTINGIEDADALNESVSFTLTSPAASASVDVTVLDNELQSIITTTGSVALGEAGTATFGVRLQFMPAANVTVTVTSGDTGAATAAPTTLTFTPANYATDQTVTVTGVGDADVADESVSITLSSTGISDRVVTASIDDDDIQRIVASAASVALSESGSATFGVHLAFQPSSNVTVSVASSNTSAATASPTTLTFTPANYATSQTVTVSGVDDIDLTSETVTITLSSSGLANETVGASVSDDDTQIVVASQATISVGEAGTATFGVRLGYQPASNVTVTVSSNNANAAAVSPATLTFTPANYATEQTVTVTGVDDNNVVNESVTITASATGATSATVAASVADDDEQAIVVSVTSVMLGEAGTATFGVSLAYQPSANVTVNVASSDTTAATAAPATLTFTPSNYSTAQTVTVTGVADVDLVNESVTITLSSSSAPSKTVTASVTDDDTQAIVTNVTSVAVAEGGTGTFRVRLAFQPSSDVTVSLANSDSTAASLSVSSLTFTPANYATEQSVTVTGLQDSDLVDETVTFTLSTAGAPNKAVAGDVNDNDTQAIVVVQSSIVIPENNSANVQVSLAFQPASNVTVNVSSSNTAAATVNVTTLTFTPSNYSTQQSVLVSGVQDTDTATNTATINFTATGATSDSVSTTVTDDDLISAITAYNICYGDFGELFYDLVAQPFASVTTTISSSVPARSSPSPTSHTFTTTNYSTAQYSYYEGNSAGSVTFTVSAPGQTSRSKTISVLSPTSPACSEPCPTCKGAKAPKPKRAAAPPPGFKSGAFRK